MLSTLMGNPRSGRLHATTALCAWLALAVGCADKAPKDDAAGKTTSKTKKTTETAECEEGDASCSEKTTGGAFELCGSLKSNVKVSGVSAVVEEFCDSATMKTLRDSNSVYKGSGSPPTNVDGKAGSNNVSDATTATSMLVPASAKAYFDMIKLQISDPDGFKSQGYEGDPALTYKVLSKKTNETKFDFDRPAADSDEEDVSYTGTTTFYELKKDEAYALATVHNEARKTIKTLKVVAVILKKGSSSEVFSIAIQTFDNNNNHKAALSKLERRIATEMERNYKNGVKAGKK